MNEWFAAVRARVPRGAQLQIPCRWWTYSRLTVPLGVLALPCPDRPRPRPRVPARVQTVHPTTNNCPEEFATESESDAKGPTNRPYIAIRYDAAHCVPPIRGLDRRATPTIPSPRCPPPRRAAERAYCAYVSVPGPAVSRARRTPVCRSRSVVRVTHRPPHRRAGREGWERDWRNGPYPDKEYCAACAQCMHASLVATCARWRCTVPRASRSRSCQRSR